MELSQQKEQFSKAYVRALAAAAGFDVEQGCVDDDSIDVTIKASRSFNPFAPRIDMQLKCSARAKVVDGSIKFRLKRKNYDDLRGDTHSPRLLVLMLVPPTCADWVIHNADHTLLYRCAYYVSLKGLGPATVKGAVSVTIPASQTLTVNTLHALMTKAGNGVPL